MDSLPPPPAAPFDETERLAALHALNLLDTAPERTFDALTALAAQLLGCPTALITLVDRDRQWVKARHGTDLTETARSIAFCDHTIRTTDRLVVPDATRDPRFADNPLVVNDPHIRFYAGAPIHAMDSRGAPQPIGAVCVIDSQPHKVTPEIGETLRHLATLTEALIASRNTAREALLVAEGMRQQAAVLRRQERTFRQAERLARIGSWRYRLEDEQVEWSDEVYRIHGMERGNPQTVAGALDFYPPHARAAIADALTQAVESGTAFDIETDFINARGEHRRVRSIGELELEHGRPVSVIGVFQDVTERHRLEQDLRDSAHVDPVTRIANRACFNEKLEEAVARAGAEGTPLLLAMIDLDDFKGVNDTLGHLAGDDLLRAVGERLRHPWLAGSFAARLGGDEFAVIVEDATLCADPARFAERLSGSFAGRRAGDVAAISATVGTALLGPETATARDLMHAADTALYEGKRRRQGERRRA